MNRNIGISKETLDKVKLAKKYIESRYTKMIQNETRNSENWRKVLNSMENQNLNKNYQLYITEKIHKQLSINKRLQRQKDSLSNYELYNIIGRGAFGEVRLAKNISTNQLVAIKRLQKKRLIQKKQLYNAYLQRDFLVESKCTFLIQMKSAFQDKQYLYIAMQYAAGGDLLHLLIEKDIFSEEHTKFYIAQMISAVQQIHKMNYIHRDIKPDNILLDSEGHVKISDFGLSKYVQKKREERPTLTKIQKLNKHMNMKNRQSKAFSKVGTPDYISPEVLTENTYDHSIDIWGIGVLMFQCLFGYPPFADEQPKQVCYKVINWRSYLQFPSDINITTSAKMLIFGLINQKSKRLSLKQIKSHPFFNGINWNTLKQMKPPFIPKLSNQTDVGNFDIFQFHLPWTNEERVRNIGHFKKKSSSLECDFKFVGFDYKKIQGDPLQEMKRNLEENSESKTKPKRSILREKKRLKTQQSSKRDQTAILKNTLSFVKPFQKQNMMKTSKKIVFYKKQKKYKSSKSKKKNTSLKVYKLNLPAHNKL